MVQHAVYPTYQQTQEKDKITIGQMTDFLKNDL